MKITSNCQPIRPLFKGYKEFDGKQIKTSDYRMWKDNIFIKDVVQSANTTFKKLTILDSRTNKPIAQKVKEVVKGKKVSFKGYKSILKTLFLKGELPVLNDLYGSKLTPLNCTLEHLQCRSHNGKTELANLALATKINNSKRGNQPLKNFLTQEQADEYLKQFRNVKVDGFDGNRYIHKLSETIRRLLRD